MKISCKELNFVLDILGVLGVTDVSVVPTEEGWEFYARDGTNCSMASILLKRRAFSEDYEVWEPFTVAMKFLKEAIQKRNEVTVAMGDGFMTITYEKSRSKTRLLTMDETPRLLPRVELRYSVALDSDALIGLAKEKQFAAASEAELGLVVEISPESFTMSYETHRDAYENSVDVLMSDLPEGNQISHYGEDLLLPIMRVLPPSTPMVVYMETDYPIKFVANTETLMLTAFVAPRIDN